MTAESLRDRAQFAVNNPGCLHSPQQHRELIAELLAENDRVRRRADGHWETLRSIREFARQGDCDRIIRWVNDAGSGYTQSTERTIGQLMHDIAARDAEITRLDALINTPETRDFLEGVKREAAHQLERWGRPHDRSKSAENWFWLVGYLAGKALRAAITGDKVKARHHTISTAAALMHWHTAILADETGAGIGRDDDLKEAA